MNGLMFIISNLTRSLVSTPRAVSCHHVVVCQFVVVFVRVYKGVVRVLCPVI